MNTDSVDWRKSSLSADQDNCIEVALFDNSILVRDSKDTTGPILTFTREEWDAFVEGAKNGEFDI